MSNNDPRIVNGYKQPDGTNFIDICHLFASNIHADADGDHCLYFNDHMAPMFANASTYIPPIKNAGTKVLLSVLGDWQHVGVANMTETQADRFADILVYVVDTYGLDGISFDDEYADYTYTLPTSYSRIIKALKAKFDRRYGVGTKLITVFQWGNYSLIDATAGAMLNYADHGYFGYNQFISSSSIAGVQNDGWMPMAIQLGSTYTASQRLRIKNNATAVLNQGYGGCMFFNIRRYSELSPLPVFMSTATGLGRSVSYVSGSDYAPWAPTSGVTITKNDAPAYPPTYTD